MAKSAGFWSGSDSTEEDVIGIDFTPNLGSATIASVSVAGTNCTATLVAISGAVVSIRYEEGDYAGKVVASVTLSDGRVVDREVQLRFS